MCSRGMMIPLPGRVYSMSMWNGGRARSAGKVSNCEGETVHILRFYLPEFSKWHQSEALCTFLHFSYFSYHHHFAFNSSCNVSLNNLEEETDTEDLMNSNYHITLHLPEHCPFGDY